MPRGLIRVSYVTSSEFKRVENQTFCKVVKLADGRGVGDVFEFDIRPLPIKEVLETDLKKMVEAEVLQAYALLKIPCVVEHAGLVFEGYDSYPGGLTKPMWDFLKDKFVTETGSAARRAIARAVVAYCDGRSIRHFVGETKGCISAVPRGGREFYWDTVFIPDEPSGVQGSMTYAEIFDDPKLGLPHKIAVLSQSARAMLAFLEYRLVHDPEMWHNV
jgi:XTP/dITP diphosphohydrolase